MQKRTAHLLLLFHHRPSSIIIRLISSSTLDQPRTSFLLSDTEMSHAVGSTFSTCQPNPHGIACPGQQANEPLPTVGREHVPLHPHAPSVSRSNCLHLHRPTTSLSLSSPLLLYPTTTSLLHSFRTCDRIKNCTRLFEPKKRTKIETMAISVNSCLCFCSSTPPLTNSSPPRPKSSKVSPWPGCKEAGWRTKSLVTAAAVIVTIGAAAAIEGPEVHAAETGSAVATSGGMRWSEKRKCPPWRANTLESIVPENLPRPPPGQRPNSITAFGDAPALSGGGQLRRYSGGCFSL